jgi:hypothetical protein
LERAVKELMQVLEKQPAKEIKNPPYPRPVEVKD